MKKDIPCTKTYLKYNKYKHKPNQKNGFNTKPVFMKIVLF